METIKKYYNRKLYSLTLNKYVTLAYIKYLIKTDQTFQVISNKTNEDITTDTMMQTLRLINLDRSKITAIIKEL